MSGSLHNATFRRLVATERLNLDGGTTSQWIDAATFRSGFVVAVNSTDAAWTIEAQLPTGAVVPVGQYEEGKLFVVGMPRYITTNAMCGLPIRFVSSQPQLNNDLWIVFKS